MTTTAPTLSWGVVVQNAQGQATAGWVIDLGAPSLAGVYEVFTSGNATRNRDEAIARLMSEPE